MEWPAAAADGRRLERNRAQVLGSEQSLDNHGSRGGGGGGRGRDAHDRRRLRPEGVASNRADSRAKLYWRHFPSKTLYRGFAFSGTQLSPESISL